MKSFERDYEAYIIKPATPDDVATIPLWLYELTKAAARRRFRWLAWAAAGLAVALIVALVWR